MLIGHILQDKVTVDGVSALFQITSKIVEYLHIIYKQNLKETFNFVSMGTSPPDTYQQFPLHPSFPVPCVILSVPSHYSQQTAGQAAMSLVCLHSPIMH